jgi:hypothetical protein
MSVRQLQKALDDANINWSDCIEKQDLVQKLTQWRGTLAHQQTEDQPEQKTTERAVEADTQQPAARKEHEAPQQEITVVMSGKAVTVSVRADCTAAQLKQQLCDSQLTSLVPAAQRILSRGKVLADEQRCIPAGGKSAAKFMVLRDPSYAPTEIQLTLRLPSAKLQPVQSFAPPSVTLTQLKALLRAHHHFPPADCYSLFRGGVKLSNEKTLQHFCIDDVETVEFDVVPVVLLKLHASTRVTGGAENGTAADAAAAGSSSDGGSASSGASLVPSSLRTGLVGADAGAAGGAALHITTHMEVAYPPHPMLLPSSRKQMAQQCLAYVEKDMAAGAPWARRLQAAMHLAVIQPMSAARTGVPVQLPAEVAYRAVKKLRRFHSVQRTQRRQQQRQGRSPMKAGSSAGFARGFLNGSNPKDKTKKQQREEQAVRQAARTAAVAAVAATTAAAECAAAAKKATKKKKKRKFKSLMADLMAPKSAPTTSDAKKAQQEILAKANPKIEFSKLDRI